MSRTHKSRRGFRINSILEKLVIKNEQQQNPGIRGYMTLTFLGFYDKKCEYSQYFSYNSKYTLEYIQRDVYRIR